MAGNPSAWLPKSLLGRILCIKLIGIWVLTLPLDAISIDQFQAKLVVLNAPRYGQQLVGSTSYHVRKYSNGEWVLYSLVFGPNVVPPGPELKTGDAVELIVDLDKSGFVASTSNPSAVFGGPPGTLYVWSWSGVPDSNIDYPLYPSSSVYYTGDTANPLRLSMAVWVITSVCGSPVASPMTAQRVSEVLFGAPAGAALRPPAAKNPVAPPLALNRLLSECSYGNIALKRSNTLVLNLSLPCSGTRPNGAKWDASPGSAGISGACGMDELFGWMEYAVQFTRQTRPGFDPSAYSRRVLVLPPADSPIPGYGGALCPDWQQRGSFGCDETEGCDIWIRGDSSPSSSSGRLLQRFSTQLGSSMLLQPAETSSSITSTALTTLTASTATSQQPTDPTCPLGSTDAGAYSCFNGPNAYKLYLAEPVHRFDVNNIGLLNATQPPQGLEPAPPSVLLAALSPGESYWFDPAKIVVRFQSLAPPPEEDAAGLTGGEALLELCRYTARTEADGMGGCFDGMDNDCDGLVDYEDEDCISTYGY
ncbi:hypothetical protein VOLCADRAFT_105831 [Volvox carteri f. nagariensis]|uniref:Uncharacterized protein n=1 Tax=Volvox carteri f. nagariensis TaxID=3068 RepID=D8U3G0_VOLCA|nr:uncharacterized protein VOLCADRAFT_105831 [Volvox carteri f. nagariensis]EFJ45818.1 hypothetical protein VOLCADRAFT_105831 [Volvox carteri f. nagariensis]|eukprot:XP_002953219.1 hypothetical protein VOLCADRAFT_105831 [Volvox carteri f. nagariensis]